jgi:hypothetical protein
MKPRTLAALALATVVFIAATVALNLGGPAYTAGTGGGLVFPSFAKSINDAAKITVATADRKFTIERTDKGWAVADKHDYPAKFDTVKATLVGLAQLKTIEAKTAEPSFYARLEVDDPSEKGAKGELLTVEDGKGGKLASIVLGKRHFGQGGNQGVDLYVRKAGDAQSWLATGTLERNDDLKQWMQRDIVSLESDRVRQVTVTPAGGKPFTLSKAKPGDSDYTLADVPPEDQVKSPYELNSVASAIGLLLLDDVLPAADLKPDAKLLRTLEYRSFDGLVIALSLYEQDGKQWAKIKAEYDAQGAVAPAPADKVKLMSADEVKKEVETINARGKDWAFGLAQGDLATLEKNFADLIGPKEKPKS